MTFLDGTVKNNKVCDSIFQNISRKMPFEAIAISHETLEALKVADKKAELANTNPYTIEWFLRNNIMDCRYGRINGIYYSQS